MTMNISKSFDSAFTVKNHTYTIRADKETYLLKRIRIQTKEAFTYAFIGGMWYSKNNFSLKNNDISLPYPFTTYYTFKILDKQIDGEPCRSCLYVKMPVFVIQFKDYCYLIKFDPCITLNNQDVFPFIKLRKTENSYEISFYLTKTYTAKVKKHAWLGRGKKTRRIIDLTTGDSFFSS
ncbi:MAG: hypothetical protein KGY50_00775, partial [Candidatus Thermoplasmatota archaeon]|nr:hypothetical protein [Candidatus Thermoplasmatota archaeon]